MKRLATALALVLTLTPLAACQDRDEPQTAPKPSSPTSTPPQPRPQPQPVTIAGVPPDLERAVATFYNHKDADVSIDPKISSDVAERGYPDAPVTGEGSTGTWKGRPIAVVTTGQDVTLAVKNNEWVIVGGWWPSLDVENPALGGARRVLAIGGDAREDANANSSQHVLAAGTEVAKSRADSLHIIAFDGQGGAGMLGIPRDSYAQLSTGGPKQKINGAMAIGGPEAELKTVQDFTGVPLEGYVLIGFEGFMRLIDTFGPLRILLKSPVKILGSQPWRNIPGGNVQLDGMQALDLARARKHVPGGDFGRSHNQGHILLSAAAMAKAVGPRGLTRYLTDAQDSLETNLTARQLLTFLAHLYTLRPLQVPNEVATGSSTKVDRRYVVMIDDAGRQLFDDIKDGNLTP